VTSVRSVVQPGWVEVSGPGVHAVVAGTDRDAETLAAAAADGLLPLLQALTAQGISEAPDFVLAATTDTGVRVVVRGSGVVVLADGTRIGSQGRMPWADLDVDLADAGEAVVLRAPDPAAVRGWRRPARLSRGAAAPAVEPAGEAVAVEPAAAAEDAPEGDAAEPEGDASLPPTQAMPVVAGPSPAEDLAAPDGAVPGDPGRPLVPAVLCPQGHPSPPHLDRCRTCDREIPPQEPSPTPRPPLGVLRVSTGAVVPLDRGVLLGRAPRSSEDVPVSERPHVLRVGGVDRDISRNHAEVVIEGWRVLVRDLGSTNGTTVTLPGQEPVRLRRSQDQELEPGSVIDLAGEVSLTYDPEA